MPSVIQRHLTCFENADFCDVVTSLTLEELFQSMRGRCSLGFEEHLLVQTSSPIVPTMNDRARELERDAFTTFAKRKISEVVAEVIRDWDDEKNKF